MVYNDNKIQTCVETNSLDDCRLSSSHSTIFLLYSRSFSSNWAKRAYDVTSTLMAGEFLRYHGDRYESPAFSVSSSQYLNPIKMHEILISFNHSIRILYLFNFSTKQNEEKCYILNVRGFARLWKIKAPFSENYLQVKDLSKYKHFISNLLVSTD